MNVEETPPKAMVAIDGVGFYWSYMAEEEVPTSMALMAFLDSESCETDSKNASKEIHNEIKESPDAPLVKDRVSDNKDCSLESPVMVENKTVVPTITKIEFVKAKQQEKPVKKPVKYAKMYRLKKDQEKDKIRTKRDKNGKLNTARPRLVNTVMPRPVNTARPNSLVFNAVRVNQDHPQQVHEDQEYVDSECSRHMTGNMSYLSDFKEFNRGYVTFGGGANGGRIIGKGTIHTGNLDFEDVYFVKELNLTFLVSLGCILFRVPRRNNMYNVDMKNIVPKESLTCLVTKATLDESMLWNRRLGYIKFKNINKLVKDKLVRGLPLKCFENDQTCIACLKGKQHKASSTKDESLGILKKFITEIENLVDKTVKVIRCDNGTKFKNSVMNDFYEIKGIRREFSVARTPQQNADAERRNKTLIEAARTMLANSKLPTTFWAEAVHTACYVQIGIGGNGPKWLFDIDVLTNSMNYVPVIAGTNSNDFVGIEENISKGHSSKETRSSQNYILMPLWKDSSLFDSSSKNATNDKPQSSCDTGNKDDNSVNKDSGIDAHEKSANSINDVNTVGLSINTGGTYFDTVSLNINTVSLTVSTASLEATHADFLEPTRVAKALTDPAWVEAMQEELLQFKLQKAWILVDLPKGKKAIGTKWGYTQEEGIDYDKVFAPVARIKAIRLFLAYASFMGLMVCQMDVKIAFLYRWIKEERKDRSDLIYQETKWRYFTCTDVKTVSTLVDTEKPLVKDTDGVDVDVNLYRSMIGSLMYLTSSRPGIFESKPSIVLENCGIANLAIQGGSGSGLGLCKTEVWGKRGGKRWEMCANSSAGELSNSTVGTLLH
uniref:Integrase catalytic domain-containing protein n=1 Tax=Tanacetum cinerariifolium TaxID=118510 RepID=A0A6L2LA17_TANCI|nr:hypothetical protein [Tanacetum cinerariifolium]